MDHSDITKFRGEIWGGYRRVRQMGDFRLDSNQKGTSFKLDNDLKMAKDDTGVGGIDLYYYGFRLGFSLTDSNFHARGALSEGSRIGNGIFAAGTLYESKFYYYWYRISAGYTFYLNSQLGFGGDIYFDIFRMDYSFTYSTNKLSGDVSAQYPSLGFHVNWSPHKRLQFTLMSHGIWIKNIHTDLNKAWFVNVRGIMRYYPIKNLCLLIRLEYEKNKYEIEDERLDVDPEFSSWNLCLGIGLRF